MGAPSYSVYIHCSSSLTASSSFCFISNHSNEFSTSGFSCLTAAAIAAASAASAAAAVDVAAAEGGAAAASFALAGDAALGGPKELMGGPGPPYLHILRANSTWDRLRRSPGSSLETIPAPTGRRLPRRHTNCQPSSSPVISSFFLFLASLQTLNPKP